jgi:hypothetical protein
MFTFKLIGCVSSLFIFLSSFLFVSYRIDQEGRTILIVVILKQNVQIII